MKKEIILFILFFGLSSAFAQVEKNVYELNSIENLLTNDVKEILNTNLKEKKVVFLGESNHYAGADLLAKTEFVKYLVLEKGYKDIAFEGDFFGLYFDHNKKHLFPFWSNSVQCKELFEFLKQNNVTIWGFDNQLNSGYSFHNFSKKMNEFLKDNDINFDKKFIETTEIFFKNEIKSNAVNVVGKPNLEFLIQEIEKLLKNDKVIKDKLWTEFLESYKSFILISSTDNSSKKGTPIRDAQMAKNLDILIKKMPEKKFIIWLHNAHMIKDGYGTQTGQTMGFQFVKLNPNISYHIAFSSINMPYRKTKMIEKYNKDKQNLLHFLPTIQKNYLIDSRNMIIKNPEYGEKEYGGMFDVRDDELKTNWLKHFDALVFISKGEDVKIMK